MNVPWDVVVVGSGPAGASAARVSAEAGARTLLLDRATHPRYKTCGGGIIGPSLAALPAGFDLPERDVITRVSFTVDGRRPRTRRARTPVFRMVDRAELDAALTTAAVAAGAELRESTTVTALAEVDDVVVLTTSSGPVHARAVVGADGSASRIGAHVGVRLAQVDLGLEVELRPVSMVGWTGRVHLDWGSLPGSYAWVFPKGDRLTVGVIAAKGSPVETRAYLDRFVTEMGLDGAEVERSSGHLTRCREPGSPLRRGRVLVCGDAAGLLEPWTREGISFALRSGALAGAAAAGVLADYPGEVERTLGVEMAAGALLHAALARRPRMVHAGIARTGPGWTAFGRVARGDATLDRALAHRPVAAAARFLARHP
ncbi:geranylgeranyl reductase family protein [Rhodococcus antarcticus]|uniref:Geranylgeranyl reductase family protein n=1 Tax=Rhodococcus antarcticus TaxID=2987751 RepID=A0ABY6NYJ1_9NOCA|nr:geranylgeranyl reductase family protein [Rhodococcus antarcticus]UZJ24460.1 geranylgeranyl reductase family protein [Rhodococcus antarcticus]